MDRRLVRRRRLDARPHAGPRPPLRRRQRAGHRLPNACRGVRTRLAWRYGPRGPRRRVLLRRPGGARRRQLRDHPRRPDGAARTQRGRQDHVDADHARRAHPGSWRGAAPRGGGRQRRQAALGLHAAGARPVPGDAGRRSGRLLRPAARALPHGGDRACPSPARRARDGGTLGPAHGQAVGRSAAAAPARHRARPRAGGDRARRAVRGTGSGGGGRAVPEPARASPVRLHRCLLQPPAGPGAEPVRGHPHGQRGADRPARPSREPAGRVDRRAAPTQRPCTRPAVAGPVPRRHRRERGGRRGADRDPPGHRPAERARRGPSRRTRGRLRARPAFALPALPGVGGSGRRIRRVRRGPRARRVRRARREVEMTWWHGMALVLGRGLREQLRSKTFKIVTSLMLLLSIGAVLVPKLVTAGPTTYTLATVGPAPAALTTSLDAAAKATGVRTTYVVRTDDAGVRSAVQHGEATVGLAGDQMYVAERTAGAFPGIVAQSLVRIETRRLLTSFGLTAAQVVQLDSVHPPEQVFVAPVQDTSRAGVGFAVGLVLYLALLFSGQIISMTVATEKASRISEVLLAVLRPSQILVGTVLAVATVATIQLLVLSVPLLVGASTTGSTWLPAMAAPDLALAITWFILGFMLFAFLYAAGGALVDKVTEAGTAVLPVTALIIAGYLLGVTVVMGSPESTLSVAVSLFPLTAPLTMPIRWASGEVPVYQLLLALGLTALTGLGCVWLASTVYRRALVITGHRVRLRELFRRGGTPHHLSHR